MVQSAHTRTNIPKEFFALLLSKINLVDLIQQVVPLQKKSNNNYFAKCPFHDEKSASFSVSQSKQFYYCFGCSAHGNAIDFIMQYKHLEFIDAVEALCEEAGLNIPRDGNFSKNQNPLLNKKILCQLMNQVASYYQTQLQQSQRAMHYLSKRAIQPHIAQQFCLGYAPESWEHLLTTFGKTAAVQQQLLAVGLIIQKKNGEYYSRFRDRLMFPIYNAKGYLVGFGGRILDIGEPKYLNSPETILFQKKQELYGIHHVLNATHHTIPCCLLVEGYMDVIALFQAGISYAVATLGTATTTHHLSYLLRYTKEVICCFDGDQAGRTAAWRALLTALPLMEQHLQLRFLFLPEGEDPDTLIRKEGKISFEARCKTALPLSTVFFETLEQAADLNTPEGRAHCIEKALSYIKPLSETIFKTLLLEELAQRLRIDIAILRQHLAIKTSIPSLQTSITSPRIHPISKNYRKETHEIFPTPIRLLILFLMQQPELVQFISEPLPQMNVPGYTMLLQLIQMIKAHPDINTGTLQEYVRDTEIDAICSLEGIEHFECLQDVKSEFLGALRKMNLLYYDIKINDLLAKMARSDASNIEKQLLSDWMQKKRALLNEQTQ